MLTPIRFITGLLGFLVLATPVAAVAFFFVAIAGSPGTCAQKDRPITTSLQNAASFEVKWNALNATLDTEQPSSATFTESEVTSIADVWLKEHDASIRNILICFHDGSAAASGKIDIPFVPGDVDVLAEGSLTLTGATADATVDDLEVGGLPGPLTNLVEDLVNRVIDDQTKQLELLHSYTLTFKEGQVTVDGTP